MGRAPVGCGSGSIKYLPGHSGQPGQLGVIYAVSGCAALCLNASLKSPPILARLGRKALGGGGGGRGYHWKFPLLSSQSNTNPILQGRLHFSFSLDSKFLGAAEPRDAQLPSLSDLSLPIRLSLVYLCLSLSLTFPPSLARPPARR